ncbi:MAG TPA: hypothetical protein EYQ58_00530, partial [Candidatus Poseidoniales archaeon]|nr:hypothetical protein [Candidatus Poseidoniales archaeon]
MGGLLDKANAAKDESVIEAEVLEPATIVEEVKADPPKNSGSSASMPDESSNENNSLSFANISTNGKIGYGLALVGFILMWFLGSYELQDYLGPIPFGILPLALLGTSFYLVWDAVGREKTVVLVVAYLMMTTVPYIAGMSFQNSAVGISDLTINEDTDELSFMVRGSFNSATALITANGVESWSESSDLSNDMHRFTVSLSEVFTANAEDYNSIVQTDYQLTVTSSTDSSTTISITPSLMNREMNDASVKFSTLTEIINDDNTDESRVVAKGIRIELALGLMNPSDGPMDGGESSLGVYKTIATDYSVDVNVKFGGNVVWSHSTITVDGIDATWTSQVSGAVSGQTVYWLGLSGTVEDDAGAEYLERDEFYEDDGCYTFEVTITNDLYSSSPTT